MAGGARDFGFEPPPEFDDYEIVGPLGRGASGAVFLANDAVLARPIAIKFLAADPDPATRQQFLLAARAAARIQHSNVVSIYRVGELGERPYIVSELVRGKPLSDPPELSADTVLRIAIDLARGLAAAHRNGVVHCDIKPANVMITEDGVAKLVDFGLARVLRDDDTLAAPVGTPDYMAPEVWGGTAPTRRSDVYSFGALVYELLAGTPPFAGVAPSELARTVRDSDPPAVPGDERLAAIVTRCLARDPSARYGSGEELREALERALASRHRVTDLAHNPYRGLRSFEAEHRGVFFGRGQEVGELLDLLRTQAVVVVAGDSGVGKSSLCRAGVLPAITDGALADGRAWRSIVVVPGQHPLAALATALGVADLAAQVTEDPGALARVLHHRADGGGIVLFIDQMEELVTVGEPGEVAAFDAAISRLSEGVAGVRLVTTARADFLSKLIAMPQFGRELARVLYFVRPLPSERIRDVITGPAAATDVSFESDAMVDELITSTAEAGSGGLPLLSFALAQLWDARDREHGVIRQAALDAMGGVSGALARHADSVITQLPPADRAHARRALLRLVTSVGTRARRSEAELIVSPDMRSAVEALVRGRLLVVHETDAGPTYEVAHEVLVRGWATLRAWLDADASEAEVRERLAEATAEWLRLGKRNDATWRGAQLAEALALDAANLAPHERAFVAASARATRQRRWLVRGALAGALIVGVSVYAVQHTLAERRLGAAVDAESAAARRDLDRARAADREQRTLATQAFAKFDALATTDAEALWDRTTAQRAIASRDYRTAARRAEAALAKDPTRDDVRALLGDILLERVELATTMRDTETALELAERIESYDADGSRRRRLAQPARVAITAPGTAIAFDGAPLGRDRAEIVAAPGVHLVEVSGPDLAPVREPILVERGTPLSVDLPAIPRASVPPGFIVIPAGSFLFGTSADDESRRGFYGTVPLHPRRTQTFLIAKHELTVGEWLAYVDAQPATQRDRLVPRQDIQEHGGTVRFDRDAAGWQLTVRPISATYTARWGEPLEITGRTRRLAQDWTKVPMMGISADDAAGYIAWVRATGQVPGARLCSEVEWTRAARGADGRETPTGRFLVDDDANLDSTYGRDLVGPDEVGAHPASDSPYGLSDTAGNIFEWTKGERDGQYVLVGGSFYHDRKTANLANRNESQSGYREAAGGTRLCADVSLSSPESLP